MPEVVTTAASWVIPVLIVLVAAAVIAGVSILLIRRSHRSPAARAAARAERLEAGAALVTLDDSLAELDVEIGLTGALHDQTGPTGLRRARMSAQHARDAAFAAYRALDAAPTPHEERRRALRLHSDADKAAAAVFRARTEHADWTRTAARRGSDIDAARARLASLTESIGDTHALVADLQGRFDESEWLIAARAAKNAESSLAEARDRLRDAAERASDRSRVELPALTSAERAMGRAQVAARTVEEEHRLIIEASRAVPSEFEAARVSLTLAAAARTALADDEAARLRSNLEPLADEMSAIGKDAARKPTATVEAIALLRERIDLAAEGARTTQKRLRDARTALPGTLAAARAAIARAEPTAARGVADARVLLSTAQLELAEARSADDPLSALETARRSLHHARAAARAAEPTT